MHEGNDMSIMITLKKPTPERGGGLRDAQIMDTATIRVAQEEDDEERIDEQDIVDGVVLFLAAIALGLFSRVLGADDAPLGAVMGTRGAPVLQWVRRLLALAPPPPVA